jgi:hypothetical protein
MMGALPWGRMLATAASLGVPPRDFWALSLAEWRALTSAHAPPGGLGARDFARLADLFPDEPDGEPDHEPT